MLKFILENMSHVAPILISGAIALLIVIERTSALMFSYPMPDFDAFFDRLRLLLMRDSTQDAIALCDVYRAKPVARIVRVGLMRAHQPQSLIENGLAIAVAESTEKINARTAFLGTIANVSTLFGLFGTIVGLVQSFEAVGNATAQTRSALLANGISTAMNATMLGLGVAIPAMIAYAILMNRAGRVAAQVDQAAVRTMDLLQQRYFATEATPINEAPEFAPAVGAGGYPQAPQPPTPRRSHR
jgi:biopolymer transport protein ExbB/TolQ